MRDAPDVGAAALRAVDRIARRHVGVVLGVVDVRDPQPVVVARGATRRPGGPVPGPDTLFEIGSVTKTFTGLLLADAVVRGEVGLDTALQELLPPGVRAPAAGRSVITVKHLATHRSGLPRSPLGYSAEVRAGLLSGDNPYRGFTVAGLYSALGTATLRRPPGTGRPRYSNFGVALLGQVLVDHLGYSDYETLVKDRICHPLGLHDTVVTPSPEQASRLAVGHGRRGRPLSPWELSGIAGAGALRSTAADLLSYVRAHLRPQDTPLAEALLLTQREWYHGRFLGSGLCWARVHGKEGVLLLHDGATGGFYSLVGLAPIAGVGVVGLSNSIRNPGRAALRLLQESQRIVTRCEPSDPRRGPDGA